MVKEILSFNFRKTTEFLTIMTRLMLTYIADNIEAIMTFGSCIKNFWVDTFISLQYL